jgi:hypothetical protein
VDPNAVGGTSHNTNNEVQTGGCEKRHD